MPLAALPAMTKEHRRGLESISQARLQFQAEEVTPYDQIFEREAEREAIMVGSLSVAEVEAEERRLEEEQQTHAQTHNKHLHTHPLHQSYLQRSLLQK